MEHRTINPDHLNLTLFTRLHLSFNAGLRFSHISNGDTESPNRGLNYLLPFLGVTAKLF